MPLRPREAHIEEPPLLGDLARLLRLPDRQLLLLEPRNEDGLELEPFRPVQGEQVDATPVRARRAEPSLQVGDEISRRPSSVVEVLREANETSEIGLAHHLPLAELLR